MATDTTTANGRLMFGFFAALAEFERELIVERTKAGLASARARGRSGELCTELGITRQTLYRHVDPKGALRPDGEKLLGHKGRDMQRAGSTQPLA